MQLNEPILSVFTGGVWTPREQLIVACKVLCLHNAPLNPTGPLIIEHSSQFLKSRLKRFAERLPTASQQITAVRVARNAAFKDMHDATDNMTDHILKHTTATRIESAFYHQHVESIHAIIAMMPSQCALLYGIPYSVKFDFQINVLFKRPVLGYFHGVGLHTRSKLLAIIAREEPEYVIMAEDDLGRTIYGPDGTPMRQEPCDDLT